MSVLRWVIIIALFYMIIRLLQGFIETGRGKAEQGGGVRAPEDRTLVRDPQCGVYFPRSEGVAEKVDGQVLYFHDAACRDRYLEERRSGAKGGNTKK